MTTIDVITIDGPAGAGKSTVAKEVAKRLGYRFLDTGAMFRSVTLRAMESGVAAAESPELSKLLESITIDFTPDGRVMIDGKDRSKDIRSAEVTAGVSAFAAVPSVRTAMADAQRRIGDAGRLVCEGRDMGTVVFPTAVAKIYLDANPSVRMERRALELEAQGFDVDRDALLRAIVARDKADSERAVAPLRRESFQHYVDSSHASRDQVIEAILGHARSCLEAR